MLCLLRTSGMIIDTEIQVECGNLTSSAQSLKAVDLEWT